MAVLDTSVPVQVPSMLKSDVVSELSGSVLHVSGHDNVKRGRALAIR